jgi:hypothetical protein
MGISRKSNPILRVALERPLVLIEMMSLKWKLVEEQVSMDDESKLKYSLWH